MHNRSDDQLLRTKIIATIGEERGKLHGPLPKERYYEKTEIVRYGNLLRWFVEAGVDVLRLNLAFFKQGGDERKVFQWLERNRNGKAKNLAILGDLPGPKMRLGSFKKAIRVSKGDEFNLHFKRKLTGVQGKRPRKPHKASVLIFDKPFGNEIFGQLSQSIKRGTLMYIGDGKALLKIRAVDPKEGVLRCNVGEIEKDGEIDKGQGVTFKDIELDLPAFDPDDRRYKRDKDALDFLLDHFLKDHRDFFTFVGVSFVKSAEDILRVRKYIEDRLVQKLRQQKPKAKDEELRKDARILCPAIIAKIETRRAAVGEVERDRERVNVIDEILDVADGLMVARGDLALHLSPEEIPSIQKELIRLCNLRGKIVITATQMLDSMERQSMPTRAEASDVFNAIIDGTDVVMLSGETSKGLYPVRAVQMMVKIAEKAERHFEKADLKDDSLRRTLRMQRFQELLAAADALIDSNTKRLRGKGAHALTKSQDPSEPDRELYKWASGLYGEKLDKSEKQRTTDHISGAACTLSEGPEYKAIIAPTASGRTARMIARFRPNVKIIGVAHDMINARKLALSFGVYPINIGGGHKSPEQMFEQAINKAQIVDLIQAGDKVICTAGAPLGVPGTTNLIQIRKV